MFWKVRGLMRKDLTMLVALHAMIAGLEGDLDSRLQQVAAKIPEMADIAKLVADAVEQFRQK